MTLLKRLIRLLKPVRVRLPKVALIKVVIMLISLKTRLINAKAGKKKRNVSTAK